MKLDEASAINAHLNSIVAHANDVLFISNNSADEKLKEAVKNTLGNAIASIDFEIWELIYKNHPGLRPPEMLEIKTSDE